MAVFNTIQEATAFLWALPLGIGKLICSGALYYVGIKGKHFLEDLKKKEKKDE